jgi:hypothetical protein
MTLAEAYWLESQSTKRRLSVVQMVHILVKGILLSRNVNHCGVDPNATRDGGAYTPM